VAEAELKRRYDKGERRFKHVGKSPTPVIEFDDSDPKKWIGKCPSGITDDDKNRLLNQAIAAPNGDRQLAVAKRLYVVHEGAIYEAQTSDGGATYHGYPYKGKLSKPLLARLFEMAKAIGCTEGFQAWVKKHIVLHGEKQ
jgi:hypothetical protein